MAFSWLRHLFFPPGSVFKSYPHPEPHTHKASSVALSCIPSPDSQAFFEGFCMWVLRITLRTSCNTKPVFHPENPPDPTTSLSWLCTQESIPPGGLWGMLQTEPWSTICKTSFLPAVLPDPPVILFLLLYFDDLGTTTGCV